MKPRENDKCIPAYSGPDSRNVQVMFGGIAPRYDFLNHLLSASLDRYWRRVAVQAVQRFVPDPSAHCLDLCSGTGDLALELQRRAGLSVVASDFCHPMLKRAALKIAAAGVDASVRNVEADALNLPFSDETFDVATIAFGLRNLEDPSRGLREVLRILRPGGALVVLEFSKPVVPVLRHVFDFYFRYVLPRIGAAISGDDRAYQYLPESVRRFPPQRGLVSLLESVGFSRVGYRNLTGGVAALHWGRKSSRR
jgi:demethylmenaquinone methyltransferase/2-methoxy-6-polyprenyl-1,4-benzoquinol methylase